MISTKTILAFIGWLALLLAGAIATSELSNKYDELPDFALWSAFYIFAISLLTQTLLRNGQASNQLIGATVFAICSIIIFEFAEWDSLKTPGKIMKDLGMLGSRPFTETVDELNDEQWVVLREWSSKTKNIGNIINLSVASFLALFGAYLGSLHKPVNTG